MITLRPATMEDAKFLLEIKNDKATRMNSIITDEIIKWEDHIVWLEKRLESPGMNVIELNGDPVGDMRFDTIKGGHEISIRLHKDFRGQGIATKAISRALGKLTAYIVEGNIPSMRTFIGNGFRPVKYIKGERINYYKFEN